MHAVFDGVIKTIRLPKELGEIYAFDVAERNGYSHLDPIDLENLSCFDTILAGPKLNNLLINNDGALFWFKGWYGTYPYDGIEIERIGYVCG